jgi:amino acid transporter
MPASPKTRSSLPKRTNWWGAFVIGLAGTILVTGVAPFAVQSMGAASIPVFLLVSGGGLVLCLCLAELSAMMPDRTGGLPSYAFETYKTFGPAAARHMGGISAWSYGLGWFPVAPLNMILAAKYTTVLWKIPLGREFMPISAPINLNVLILSIVGLLVLFIPCYLGIRLGAGFATVLGIVSMVPLTLLIFLPFLRPSTLHWSNVAGFRLADPRVGSFVFFISWIFILTWSVLGTEAAACYIGECRDSTRDAKIAMSASGLYGSLIYVAIPLLLVAVLGRSDVDPLTAFLAYTEAIFGSGGWVKWIIGIPLIVALLLSVMNAIMGCGRSLYQVSHDGVIPKFFQHTNHHGVPDFAMLFNLVASILVVFLGSPLEIYIFSNMGYLLALALALIGYFLYRQKYPDLKRPVRMPGFMRYLALVIGLFFLFVWAYGGYYSSDIAVGPGKHWLFFWGLGICFLYLPLHAYRRFVEDRKPLREDIEGSVSVEVAPPDTDF